MAINGAIVRLLLLATAAANLWAQTSAGLVVVTVQDPSGAAVAGATVTLTDETTSATATQTSGADGLARFVSVKPSVYTVAASQQGFKKTSRQHITVNVAESVTLDFTLELGAVTETVEVTGSAPLLQTERGELGQVIGRQQIVDLPLNGRNAISLAGLTSGVIPGPGFSDGPLNLANISVNGGRGGATEILQDGAPSTVPENSPGTLATATLPSVERVQEFKVQTNSFSAEFGRTTGGVINLVLKSGTNQFHGSVYEYVRNSKLDANDWFQNRAGRKLGTFQRNQYGFTLGGPVMIPGLYNGRNRTFFFGGYEGQRQRNQQTSTSTIPTAAEIGGNFSGTQNAAGQAVVMYDPQTTVRNAAGAYVRDPFPGNRIPAARIDPVAARLFTFYPQPNTPGTGPANQNNFIAAGAGAIDDDNFDVRVDHIFAPTRNFYFRLSNRDFRQVNPNFYGTIGMPGAHIIPRPGQTAAVNYTQNITPGLLSETTYGFARLFTNRQSHSFGANINKELGLPLDLAAISDNRGFPAITVAGYGAIGESFNARFSLESHTFLENVTYLRGKQSIKVGGQVRINRTNFFQGQFPAGSFAYNQAFTQGPDPTRATATGGNGIASMLLGLAASGAATHDSPVSTQSPYFAVFAQDDIKVSKSLTLNFGLRYELEIPRSERYNRLSVFNSEVTSPIASRVSALPNLKGGLEFIGKDREKQFFTDRNNFGPRFGFAWRGPRDFVLRGGYAIFYSASSATAAGTLGGGGNAGFTSRTVYNGSFDGGLTPADRLANPFPRGFSLPPGSSQGLLSFLGLEFQSNNPLDRTPYVQQWNFNIQREAFAGLLVEVSYAGSKGTNLPSIFGSINQLRTETLALGSALLDQVPNPFFGVITEPTSALRLANVQRSQLLRPFPQFTTIALEKGSYGSSIYHSLQLRVDRRFRNGVSFLAGYTWSKVIDDISNSGTGLNGPFAYTQDWFNRRAERSLSVFDVAHRLVLSGTYAIPVGKGKALGSGLNRTADAIIGGWQMNGIAIFSSGIPVFLSNSVNTSNSLGQLIGAGAPVNGTQRPNSNGQSATKSGPVVDRLTEYFTRSVFSQPAPFTHGSVGRTLPDVRNPFSKNLDLSLFKNFRITEKMMLQVRAESFNFTNTPIFGGPGAAFGVAAFGIISGQGNNPRQIQFGMRLAF